MHAHMCVHVRVEGGLEETKYDGEISDGRPHGKVILLAYKL
jgi:hypothetical protein